MTNNKIVVGIDVGFSHIKHAMWDGVSPVIRKVGTNLINKGDVSGLGVGGADVVNVGGEEYILFDSAMRANSNKVANISDYESMKKYSPIFIKGIIEKYYKGLDIDKICCGLSAVYKDRREDYIEHLQKILPEYADKLQVGLQGYSCFLSLNKFGLNIDSLTETTPFSDYLIVDIGFNTVDLCLVTQSIAKEDEVMGLEKEGLVKVADKVIAIMKSNGINNANYSTAGLVITNNGITIRGKYFNFESDVKKIKKEYASQLLEKINSMFDDVLDSVKNVIIVGGGARVLQEHQEIVSNFSSNNFAKFPVTSSEFYNAAGLSLL